MKATRKRRSRDTGLDAQGNASGVRTSQPREHDSPGRLARERERAVALIVGIFDALERSLAARYEPPLMACEDCGLDARTVRRLVARGELPARKIGRTWFARPGDIERLIPTTARPELGEPANDGAELAPEDGVDRILQGILEPRGLRLRGSVPVSPESPSAPHRGAVQASAGRRRA